MSAKIKLITWSDEETGREIKKRFRQAVDSRKYFEDRWLHNERTIYSTSNMYNSGYTNSSLEADFRIGLPSIDSSDTDSNAAYVFKNLRFIHAQMSANPPVVAMRPTSSDQDDRRKADVADRVVRWAIRHFNMQEKIDQMSLSTLLYGTGVMKTLWDSSLGDILKYDPETNEIDMEGDVSITIPFIWNLYIDPDARSMDQIKWVIEKIYMDYEEACMLWPDRKEELEKAKVETPNSFSGEDAGRQTQLQDKHYNVVELLEYWETGLPTNGYMGKFCVTTTGGDVIKPCCPSPHRFKAAGAVSQIEQMDMPDEEKMARIEKLPAKAQLPYTFLTDVDVPNVVWGRSSIDYASNMQETLNQVDSAVIENLKAHSAARLVVSDKAEITEMTNSTWDVVKVADNQPPYFMQPPQLMPDLSATRMNMKQGIDDIMGVNESMFGQQSREQSGASMQYATNQGNMIRRRLFNKYVLAVESIYKCILTLTAKHWSISRTINVVGKEKALEAVELRGADIDGGYDVVGEYGVTLSLDPVTRKQEILTMQPLFEKAGVPPRKQLELMKMNELEGMYDRLAMAGTRQEEIFAEMIATNRYIEPKKFRDHENMIAWALDYFMTQEFNALPEHIQALCEKHIEDRAAVAAQEKTGGPQNTAMPTGPAPAAPPAGEVPAPAAAPAGPVAG